MAGLRAAEALREQGHDGSITVVGDEPHLPYDRPPLSKQVLAGERTPESTALTPAVGSLADLRIEWRTGTPASGLALAAREVLLAGGEHLPSYGIVLPTGASPRRPPATAHLARVHPLLTLAYLLPP